MNGNFYLRRLRSCDEPGCSKGPIAEVIGPYNQSYGKFCREHADQALKRLRQLLPPHQANKP